MTYAWFTKSSNVEIQAHTNHQKIGRFKSSGDVLGVVGDKMRKILPCWYLIEDFERFSFRFSKKIFKRVFMDLKLVDVLK